MRLGASAATRALAMALALAGALPATGGAVAGLPDTSGSPPVVAAMTEPGYRLGPGDKVKIGVYDEATMTGEYLIGDDGNISFPLIGNFPAAGKTVPELRSGLAGVLGNGYINDPKVTAEIATLRPFYILGEVNKPGEYPYSLGLTLYKAVATAQGFTYRASTHKVIITHAGDSAEQRVRVTADTPIQPGDTIRVVEKFF